MKESDKLHTLATTSPGERPWYPLERKMIGPMVSLNTVVN